MGKCEGWGMGECKVRIGEYEKRGEWEEGGGGGGRGETTYQNLARIICR